MSCPSQVPFVCGWAEERDGDEAKTLTGVEEASKGVVTTYGLQLFFSVPSQGSTEQIRLLAVHQDILNVEVIK